MTRFRTTLVLGGKTATGFEVPSAIVAELGSGKRPPVRVTINSHAYRSTVAVMGGKFMVPVSAENRSAAGIAAGAEIDVELELDTEARKVEVPDDFHEVLRGEPTARAVFDGLSYSHQRAHVLSIDGAKTAETRARRIAKAVDTLREGRTR